MKEEIFREGSRQKNNKERKRSSRLHHTRKHEISEEKRPTTRLVCFLCLFMFEFMFEHGAVVVQ